MSNKKWRDKIPSVNIPAIAPISNQKSWIEKHGFAWAMVLLLLGAFLGSVVTVYYGDLQMQQEDAMTAQSLYNELNSPTNQIPIAAQKYEKNLTLDLSFWSLYPSSSVLPIVKTKMGRFDAMLIQNITRYDLCLNDAEQDRLTLVEAAKLPDISTLKNNSWDLSEIANEGSMDSDMWQCIRYCNYQIPIISKQLQDEINNSKGFGSYFLSL
jgi:hypothetical protein